MGNREEVLKTANEMVKAGVRIRYEFDHKDFNIFAGDVIKLISAYDKLVDELMTDLDELPIDSNWIEKVERMRREL